MSGTGNKRGRGEADCCSTRCAGRGLRDANCGRLDAGKSSAGVRLRRLCAGQPDARRAATAQGAIKTRLNLSKGVEVKKLSEAQELALFLMYRGGKLIGSWIIEEGKSDYPIDERTIRCLGKRGCLEKLENCPKTHRPIYTLSVEGERALVALGTPMRNDGPISRAR
jgi:hypothetical protein